MKTTDLQTDDKTLFRAVNRADEAMMKVYLILEARKDERRIEWAKQQSILISRLQAELRYKVAMFENL